MKFVILILTENLWTIFLVTERVDETSVSVRHLDSVMVGGGRLVVFVFFGVFFPNAQLEHSQ